MVIIMLMSDMQNKEVINQTTGANLGRIIDLDVNENGYINYLIVGSLKMIKKLSSQEYKVEYSSIKRIGKDVILVELN